jgi:Helicase associated domain
VSSSLGRWARNLRFFRKKGLLNHDKVDALDGLGFSWLGLQGQKRDLHSAARNSVGRSKRSLSLVGRPAGDAVPTKKIRLTPLPSSSPVDRPTSDGIPTKKIRLKPLPRELKAARCVICFVVNELSSLILTCSRLFSSETALINLNIWYTHLQELRAYQQANGGCTSPPVSSSLGRWARNLRFFRKKGLLTQDKVDALDSLGFSWVVLQTKRDIRCRCFYEKLQNHHVVNGCCDILSEDKVCRDSKLCTVL